MTAFAMVGDREKVIAAGFDGYVTKPIDPQDFAQNIEALLPSELRGVEAKPWPAAPPAPEAAPRLSAKGKVLVVDDWPTNVTLARRILEPFGYTVFAAASVGEALSLARETRPDVILADVHLGGESGVDLARALRDEEGLREVPFAFFSGTAPSEMEAELAAESGVSRFIQRPIEPQDLLARIEELLASRGSGGK